MKNTLSSLPQNFEQASKQAIAILIFSFLFAFVSCSKTTTPETPLSDLAALKLSYQGTEISANGTNFIISLPVGASTTSVNFTLKVSPKAKLYEGTATTALTLTGDSIVLTKDLTNAVTYKVISESGKTTLSYTLKAEARQATSKSIIGFSFLKSKNASLAEDISGTIDANTSTISVSLPYGTAKTSLSPTINHNGKSISPENELSQDFSSDKTYTVTAQDNSTQAYTVKVSVLPQTSYTVSFETNGGTPAINPIPVGANEKINKPADPTKQDSVFGGWYSDPAKTKAFDFNTPIAANTTLYAKWGENPKLTAFTLKATGIDGLSADVPADIDEASRTITLSINADPAKRASWTAISTSQITTTYTGASITPSATTLNLSADNNNVATYTVTNADGKTKVYTLKIEFVAFKIKIDWQASSTVTQYKVRVFKPLYNNIYFFRLLSETVLSKTSDGILKYKDYIHSSGIGVLVEAMDAQGNIIQSLAKGGITEWNTNLINLNPIPIEINVVPNNKPTAIVVEIPIEVLNIPEDFSQKPALNMGVRVPGANDFFANGIFKLTELTQEEISYLRTQHKIFYFENKTFIWVYDPDKSPQFVSYQLHIVDNDFNIYDIISNTVTVSGPITPDIIVKTDQISVSYP